MIKLPIVENTYLAVERLIDSVLLNSILVILVVSVVVGTILTEHIEKRIVEIKSKYRMKQFLIFLLAGFLSLSCQRKKENVSSPQTEAFTSERNAFFNYLESPEASSLLLNSIPTSFNTSLMNDPNRFTQYVGNEVKAAANMGVYLSDLNYCILFQKTEMTQEYFLAIQELSNVIGIQKSTLQFLMKRYTENRSQNDSLKAVMNQVFKKSTDDLLSTNHEKLAGLAMVTYQIENLHLALATLEAYSKKPTEEQTQPMLLLLNRIVEQRENMVTIYNFFETFSDPLDPNKNPNYPFYNNAMRELIGIYQKLIVKENPEQKDIVEIMNDSAMKTLIEQVNAIRTKIIAFE